MKFLLLHVDKSKGGGVDCDQEVDHDVVTLMFVSRSKSISVLIIVLIIIIETSSIPFTCLNNAWYKDIGKWGDC